MLKCGIVNACLFLSGLISFITLYTNFTIIGYVRSPILYKSSILNKNEVNFFVDTLQENISNLAALGSKITIKLKDKEFECVSVMASLLPMGDGDEPIKTRPFVINRCLLHKAKENNDIRDQSTPDDKIYEKDIIFPSYSEPLFILQERFFRIQIITQSSCSAIPELDEYSKALIAELQDLYTERLFLSNQIKSFMDAIFYETLEVLKRDGIEMHRYQETDRMIQEKIKFYFEIYGNDGFGGVLTFYEKNRNNNCKIDLKNYEGKYTLFKTN